MKLSLSFLHDELRQFISRNGAMKSKLAYVCNSSSCRRRNTLLVKLCKSWDDDVTAGNLQQCTGCQQTFYLRGNFSVLKKTWNCRGYARWPVWIVQFCNAFLNRELPLNASWTGELPGWKVQSSGRCSGVFLGIDFRNLLLPVASHLILYQKPPILVNCTHLHMSFAVSRFWLSSSWVI